MKKIKITGRQKLSGEINISGAKNSVVALIPAAILCDEEVTISNVPNITDVCALEEIMTYLGSKVTTDKDKITINNSNMVNKEIPREISSKLRASYYFMGALLSKYKKVEMFFPGGCPIGKRPINLHLMGFEKLGAKITEVDNHFVIEAEELIGNEIYLDIASVGATINIMLAATKASGTTIIINAAKEPEIVDVANLLNNMGANIRGAGTSEIKIVGVEKLHKTFHDVIPDRIEAGTYLIIGALLGQNLKINNIIPKHIEAVIEKLMASGVNMEINPNNIIVNTNNNLKCCDIITATHPGFPTDLQQPFTSFLTQCKGISHVTENVWENRFLNIKYLNKMGADIILEDNTVTIKGKTELFGKTVVATDLRAGACLVIAGLIAEGETVIEDVEHILRGYDNIIEKLTSVGAIIKEIDF